MKHKLFTLSLVSLFLGSIAYAQNAEVNKVISSNQSGTLIVNPAANTNYTVTIDEGVTYTNTTMRVVNDVSPTGSNTYLVTGDGNLIVSCERKDHAVVLGNGSNKTPNSSIIFDVNTTINKGSAGGSNLTLTNEINVSFYKNLNASELTLGDNGGVANSLVTFGKADATDTYTATLNKISAKTNTFTVNSNYTVNVASSINAKSINLVGGTMTGTTISAASLSMTSGSLTGTIITADSINMTGGTINATTISAKTANLSKGTISVNTISSADAIESLTISGGSITAKKELYVGDTLVTSGGLYTSEGLSIKTGSTLTQKGGTVHGSYGLRFSTGSTYEYYKGTGPSQIVTSGGTVKLYNNFATGLIKVNGANTLDLYWNGFSVILAGSSGATQGLFTDGNANATFNLIVESGYNWENDKLFIGNITEDQLYARIGAIQIGDTRYEKGEWYEIIELVAGTTVYNSKDVSGFYINLVNVPEPAEWALIFGTIAFGFIAYRRRK